MSRAPGLCPGALFSYSNQRSPARVIHFDALALMSARRPRRVLKPFKHPQKYIYPDGIDTSILPGYILGVSCSVFHQFRQVASGTNGEVAFFLKDKPQGGDYLVFDDATGRQLDLDLRGG